LIDRILRKCILLKEIHKGWYDEEEDVSSYWVTLRKLVTAD
jgi:hypothetical protein